MPEIKIPVIETTREKYDELATKEPDKIYMPLEDDNTYSIFLNDKQAGKPIVKEAISATYDELSALKAASGLRAGQVYLISDYKTTYIQPVSNKLVTCDPEPLYITAVSSDRFAPIVISSLYPTDVVYYNFDDSKCENNSTPRPGFILRRIDPTRRIDMPNDWRFMKWARFKVDTSEIVTWEEGLGVTKGSFYITDTSISKALRDGTPTSTTDGTYFVEVVADYANNYFLYSNAYGLTRSTEYAEYYTFDLNNANDHGNVAITNVIIQGGAEGYRALPNNVWRYSASSERTRTVFASSRFENNTFGSNCSNITFGSSCYGNTFGSNCPNITFGSNCYNNMLGSDCHSNMLGSSCHSNIFESNCYGNTFGSNCPGNILGSNCYGSAFESNCRSNTFGSNCSNITFGSSCYGNTFGSNCPNITFGSNCYNNMFGSSCYNNTFSSNCYGNTFGSNCYNNMFGSNCPSNMLGSNCHSNVFGSNCPSNTFGLSCRFNRLEPYIRALDFSSVAEIHGKNYNHDIFINSANVVTVHWRDANNQDQYLAVT